MQYTEEHYAQLYNELPEGLKDLVLSGRLAILVSAIGSRHGLNADQVADLEPAIEDVCLGLITKDELVDNILKTVNVDQRVANRIAAEAELEILRPFDAELVIARKQKEDLDGKINKDSVPRKTPAQANTSTVYTTLQNQNKSTPTGPRDVSGHADVKKVSDWYNKNESPTQSSGENGKPSGTSTFDWDKDFAKKPIPEPVAPTVTQPSFQNTTTTTTAVAPNLETKLDVLTESINKLINSRFGEPEKKQDSVSSQMQELLKRLEKAEKENEENKKLIRNLQTNKNIAPTEKIFGATSKKDDKETKIQIDKPRKVEIDKTENKITPIILAGSETKQNDTKVAQQSGTEQLGTDSAKPQTNPVQTQPEIVSSTVSKDTLDTIVETRNKTASPVTNITSQTSTKKVLSLEELVSKADDKIKQVNSVTVQTGTMTFPGVNDEKKIDIKNITQKDSMRQTLLDDLEYLKNATEGDKTETSKVDEPENVNKDSSTPTANTTSTPQQPEPKDKPQPASNSTDQNNQTSGSVTLNQFKDELLPKTKEERMRALQDKIKALNKGVSVGGKTNISASGFDPYRL